MQVCNQLMILVNNYSNKIKITVDQKTESYGCRVDKCGSFESQIRVILITIAN